MKYLKEYKEFKDTELIEEGVKEWILTGLMTLAGLNGVLAQSSKEVTPEDVKKAEMVQKRIDSGDLDNDGVKDIDKYFKASDIEKNKENLEKLKSNIGSDSQTSITTSAKVASDYIKLHDYTIKEIVITKDTIFEEKVDIVFSPEINISIKDSLETEYKSGDYGLSEETIKSINEVLKELETKGLGFENITILSSTDKEPISMGNEELANKRANKILDYLNELEVDTSLVNIDLKPNSGPDIFSKDMTEQERIEARKKTKEYRKVEVLVNINTELSEPVKPGEVPYKKIEERIQITLERIKPEYEPNKSIDIKIFVKKPKVGKVINIKEKKKYKCRFDF
jgi:flagellar motor protein MotB